MCKCVYFLFFGADMDPKMFDEQLTWSCALIGGLNFAQMLSWFSITFLSMYDWRIFAGLPSRLSLETDTFMRTANNNTTKLLQMQQEIKFCPVQPVRPQFYSPPSRRRCNRLWDKRSRGFLAVRVTHQAPGGPYADGGISWRRGVWFTVTENTKTWSYVQHQNRRFTTCQHT